MFKSNMMRTKQLLVACAAMSALAATTAPGRAGVGDTDQERQARWQDLQKTIFGDKKVRSDDAAVTLDAPVRAEDAALVPIGITLADPKNVKALYLVIDDNPSPLAAHFSFGPDVDPKTIKLRVRVNTYTDMHAVAEMRDGTLVQTTKFVKASGGCSAPMGVSDEEAMQGMGDMRFKIAGDVAASKPVDATLMIRHPNFNGMQMNQVTRQYTPARYIQTIAVSFGDKKVFNLDTDISLASNPVIAFALLPDASKGSLKVDVKDSQEGTWSKTFNVPTVSN
jgi:sulfur-oxidizing protein SoxY